MWKKSKENHGQRDGSALRIKVLSQRLWGEFFEGSNDPFQGSWNRRSCTLTAPFLTLVKIYLWGSNRNNFMVGSPQHKDLYSRPKTLGSLRTTDIKGLGTLPAPTWRRPLLIPEDGHPLRPRLFHACSTQNQTRAHTHALEQKNNEEISGGQNNE